MMCLGQWCVYTFLLLHVFRRIRVLIYKASYIFHTNIRWVLKFLAKVPLFSHNNFGHKNETFFQKIREICITTLLEFERFWKRLIKPIISTCVFKDFSPMWRKIGTFWDIAVIVLFFMIICNHIFHFETFSTKVGYSTSKVVLYL